jgi:DNA gyrase subunit A
MLQIIRKSDGKADASTKIQKRFGLTEEQAEAILELKLYRLARLEIHVVRKELAEKRAEVKRLEKLLDSEKLRWKLVRDELADIRVKYATKRLTKVTYGSDEPEYQAEDFIALEDANVVLSAQGWVKRVREIKDLGSTRLRDGDSVAAVVAGSTRAAVAFFSNLGGTYVARIHDVPPSTGYGDPVQKLFKLADGERMITALSFDPRVLEVPAESSEKAEPEAPFALAVTRGGLGFVFSLRSHGEPSTRAGRRFARLNEGDEVLAVLPVDLTDLVLVATTDGHALSVPASELALLSGTGKGSTLIKVAEGERVLGVVIAQRGVGSLVIETEKGKTLELQSQKILGSRGDRGSAIVKRDRFARLVLPPVTVPQLTPNEA